MTKKQKLKEIYRALEKDHKIVFRSLRRLETLLSHLRYGGAEGQSGRLSEARSILAYFRKELLVHMRSEERTLFPFLRRHIPRLEPMVYLLLSEHEDFRANLAELEAALDSGRVDAICERGTYLICLLRTHMWAERESMYMAADNELRHDEKKKLMGLIKRQKRRTGMDRVKRGAVVAMVMALVLGGSGFKWRADQEKSGTPQAAAGLPSDASAVTGEEGTFSIPDVPAGRYTLEAWHEKLGVQTAEVTVTDGQASVPDFSYKLPA